MEVDDSFDKAINNQILSFTEKTFPIQPNQLTNGHTYNFTLSVTSRYTKYESENHAFQVIKIVQEISDILRIKCIRNCRSNRINPQGLFHLKAICVTCNIPGNFVWKVTPSAQTQLLNSSRLVMRPNTLAAGGTYTFKVSLLNGTGFASLQMFTSTDISETCTVDPLEGVEALDEFTVNCTQGTFPLVYTLFQGETKHLSSNNPVIKSKLNAGNGVEVRIENAFGEVLVVQLKVNIAELPILSSIEDIFTSKNDSINLKRIIADEPQSSALVFINAIASRLNKLQAVDATDTVTQILSLMNEVRIDHFDDISPVTNTLRKLLQPIRMDHQIAKKSAEFLDKITVALQNYGDVSVWHYVDTTNHILSVINQIIDPFQTIPPVQNENSLISHEYHTEDYKYYGELDVEIFEKLENLETVTLSIEKTISELSACAAMLFQPLELMENMTVKNVKYEVMAFDQELARGDSLQINGTTIGVTVSNNLISHLKRESSISCTFFNKSPVWWFSDGVSINSDVVSVSIYKKTTDERQENVREITKLQMPLHLSIEVKNVTRSERNDFLQSSANISTYKIRCPRNGMVFIKCIRLGADATIKIYFNNRPMRSNEILKANYSIIIDGTNQELGASLFNYKCSIVNESFVYMTFVYNGNMNTTMGNVEFSFELSTVECVHWETTSYKWKSDACLVDQLSTFNQIHCECKHLSLFAVKHYKSDFCAVYPDYSPNTPMKNVIWICILFSLLAFTIMVLRAWRSDKLDKNNQKLIYLKNERIRRPYYYSITVVTGSSRNVHTTSHVGIKIHGSEFESKIIPLFIRGEQLFQRGSINSFAVQIKKCVGRIEGITLVHCNGPWYCECVIIRDLQRNEEWIFDVNRWFAKGTCNETFTACISVMTKEEFYKRKRLIHLHWKNLLRSSYSIFSVCLRRAGGRLSRVQGVCVTFASILIGLMANVLFLSYNQNENHFVRNIIISAIIGLCTTFLMRLVLISILMTSKNVKKNRNFKRIFGLEPL